MVFVLAVAVTLDVALSLMISTSAPVFTPLAGLGLLVPQLAVHWRRLHDTDRSGAWCFLGLVPFGGIVVIVFACTDSTPGPDRCGPSPEAGTASSSAGYGPGCSQP